MKRKGLIGWLAAVFFMGVFAALFAFIFLYFFKYHVTMMMVDYYFWNKEYDIPLALLSTDINNAGKYESSIISLNKLYYADVLGYSKENLEKEVKSIVDKWVISADYTLTFGKIAFKKEIECDCSFELISETQGTYMCVGNTCPEETIGEECDPNSYKLLKKPWLTCRGTTRFTEMGAFPLPVVFNGTSRITELKFVIER